MKKMEIAYASRPKIPVGVIMIDIDDFKQVKEALYLAKKRWKNRSESLL